MKGTKMWQAKTFVGFMFLMVFSGCASLQEDRYKSTIDEFYERISRLERDNQILKRDVEYLMNRPMSYPYNPDNNSNRQSPVIQQPTPDQPANNYDSEKKETVKKPEGSKRSATVQCSATTKKGKRCSRMTSSPNGLCWQHGGN